jgi:hypothetical protein
MQKTKMHTDFSLKISWENRTWENTGTDGKIIVKWISRETGCKQVNWLQTGPNDSVM